MSNGKHLKKDHTIGLTNGRNELIGVVDADEVPISSALVQVTLTFDPDKMKKNLGKDEKPSITIVMSKSKWDSLKPNLTKDQDGETQALAAIFPTNIELEVV